LKATAILGPKAMAANLDSLKNLPDGAEDRVSIYPLENWR
jgi:hypothetical protein